MTQISGNGQGGEVDGAGDSFDETGAPAEAAWAEQAAEDESAWEEPGSEAGDEIAWAGSDGGGPHGAEDPQEFRQAYSNEYNEPLDGGPHRVESFQDPRLTAGEINPLYVSEDDITDSRELEEGTAYRSNCADCARCFESTWRGQAYEAGGNLADGEPIERMEQWANEEWTETSPSDVAEALEMGGPGSSAIVGTTWEGPEAGGHAYNAVNYEGRIETVDPQSGEVFEYSQTAIHPSLESASQRTNYAMVWDASGRRIL
ncbi:MAG: hypothetical protein LBJ62_10560 [Bifidobacteriaceae bacterium]|nr:hypothetical protein [Bifidobacteriaceae bacterium]